MEAFAHFFASADPQLALVALTFHLANIGLRSLAWRNVLRASYPDRRVPLPGIAGAYAAGMALNSFVPARGGDAAKIVLARTQIQGSSVATVGSSMGVLSAFDAVMGGSVILALASLGFLPELPALPAFPSLPIGTSPLLLAAAGLLLAACFVTRRRSAARLRSLWSNLRLGFAILGAPRRYATEIVPLQVGAWSCRIGTAFFLLAALHVPATLGAAAIVVVVGGLSTFVPTPGGAGTQQVMLAYLLHTTASTATIVSFSIGMQAAVTTLNVLLGMTAAMLMLRTGSPLAAIRALRQR